ncbi:glycosyltransferase BC10 isoform X2 [Beta vulgaris subsp. vulgaris]|uniref:glycosyltransferase BC10 isoform X2 n=1 Tax=Beta vulgaris subsp. vulgaris TaxID=3555 RepID=UPI00203728FD|nr:glycosyltransferase BC10 isoform X2 [Beta vulgaris subsp. vulgaris]
MKRRTSFQNRSQQKWKSRLLFMLLLCLCVGSFILLLESNPPTMNLPILFAQKPKIAFLFIARNRLPLDFVWDVFFQADNNNRFTVFVHSRPGFLFSKATTKSPYFLNRQVNGSVQIDWGEASMIQAERILLQKALVDHTNERFVFLSDSFADTKEGRYNPKMHPVVPVNNWRKGSQWVVLNRKHAETVVKDETVFPVFQQHCKCVQLFREHIPKKKSEDQQDSSFDRIISSKRKSLPEFWRDQPFPVDTSKEHNCIPDEHYIQTLLAQEGLEKEITRRSLTHTAWDLSVSKDNERRGWHPVTYKFSDATSQLIHSIKEIDNIFYETENRREWCSSKGKPSPCFLFARKFTRPAASRILNLSVLGT